LPELTDPHEPSPTIRQTGDEDVRVLVVDDEDSLRNVLARVLRQRGMIAHGVSSGALALEALQQGEFDVILCDVRMPEMSGPQLLAQVKAAGYSAEMIMMTAFADIMTTVSAVKAGAYGFLTKPFASNEAVVLEVLNAAQYKRLRERNEKLQAQLSLRPPAGEMVGSSPKMRDVYRLVEGVATSNSTVLVTGESGTGKELVARAIHDRSRRAKMPMVTINCGAIPAELVESELFGHTRGAFTTAMSARAGLFEAANGGTLFLDEIGDLPVTSQVKLLRTLQSGEVKPIGSDTVKTVDVRVIAATNVDLKAAISSGTFRQDLFYRLNVLRLHLPPLRERGDDVLLLAHHFIQKHAALANKPAPRLSHEAAMLMQQYPWPGNVRELEHAIEHAVVLTSGDVIAPNSLPGEILADAAPSPPTPQRAAHAPRSEPHPVAPGSSGTASSSALLEQLGVGDLSYSDAKKAALAAFNDAYIARILEQTNGNVSEAARRSGLDRSNFRRLLRSTSSGKDSDE
jgi:DNA-binding NtrC family response regulator